MNMEKNDKAAILIVDDRQANIIALENLLAAKDRIIYSANSGKEALKTVINKEVDLIILDVQMPEMDGFEVANILKSNKRTQEIPIIFASAERKEHQFMMKGFGEGAIDYLFKPLDPEIAKAKVTVFLKLQMQKKELIEKNISLQKSALLIENSADIIGIIDSATLKIEEINSAFTHILGYEKEEAKEVSLPFFLSAENRTMVTAFSKQAKEQFQFETAIYCKNRAIKWLQFKVVVKDSKWFINARDITELKIVERIRNYLATVVKQSNDAIYIYDSEGKIISWNEGATEIYGYSEKEALLMRVWNIIPEFLKAETDDIVNKILQGNKIQDLETKRITKHGKLIDVLFSASVLHDDNSGAKSIAITEQDITQQKIADTRIKQLNIELKSKVIQLEASNKELESFSYSVSHDLRAPLRAINGYVNIIEHDHGDKMTKEIKDLFEVVKKNSVKMGVLIDDLLAFSRMGRREVEREKVDTEQLVKEIIADIPEDTVMKKLELKMGTLLPAYGDKSLLKQVWINLISNAIKYSSKKDKPVLEIGSSQTDTEITYYVKDNGVGFDMNYKDKLFGVFQRLHSNNEFEGTGVGLAIVNRIISKHGGRIWADAEVNKGASFYFTLPVLELDTTGSSFTNF